MLFYLFDIIFTLFLSLFCDMQWQNKMVFNKIFGREVRVIFYDR